MLVHLHGASGLGLTAAHELLSREYRVVAFEMPGFGTSAENTRTRDTAEPARTIGAAAQALGLDSFNPMGTSFGGKAALWMGLQKPERVLAPVLESPAAIRPPGAVPPPAHRRKPVQMSQGRGSPGSFHPRQKHDRGDSFRGSTGSCTLFRLKWGDVRHRAARNGARGSQRDSADIEALPRLE